MKLTHALFPAALLGLSALAGAQGPPPPPPPPPPLLPPPVPAGNPITPEKVLLGKALFWDEQLSSTRTVACGTCHILGAGSSDPRSDGSINSQHAGPDGLFGTADDITGSPGVIRNQQDGHYLKDPSFDLRLQVTARKSPSAINAAYANQLFWDGRADDTFVDPISGVVVLPNGAALESQAVAPVLSDIEMAHIGRDWPQALDSIDSADPLALARDIPTDLANFVNGKSYAELFEDVFGSPGITAPRFAMAVATYERTLISNQAKIDLPPGPGVLTQQEVQGLQIFNSPQARCNQCHSGPTFSDNQFHYIGVRPQNDDLGRFAVTGNVGDRGRMKTPSLRNVGLREPLFHNGGKATLEEVVVFYNQGGDFNGPNKDPRIQPLGLDAVQRAALVAFLRGALTDQRVANETPPFDRPTLYSESNDVPELFGVGTPGTGLFPPHMIAVEPPKIGNPNFTLAMDQGLGGRPAFLAADIQAHANGITFAGMQLYIDRTPMLQLHSVGPLSGVGAGEGWDSVTLSLPNDPALIGSALFCQWFVLDPDPAARFAASEGLEIRWF
jgi:cytochrome c peroxidase